MVTRNFVVSLPAGGTASVLRSLKSATDYVNAKVDWKKGDVLEFSSSAPDFVLLKIKLIYPSAVIKEKIQGKEQIVSNGLPTEWIEGIVSCPNKNCVTAQPKEPSKPRFKIVSSNPPTLQCYYCGRYMDHVAILAQLV
jgi:aspartate carbamoyltransferase regulatory subunit